MGKKTLALAGASAVALCLFSASAETLEPVAVEYDVEAKEDDVGAVCHLLVLVSNFPRSPEAVKFTLTFAVGKKTQEVFVAFIVDVGDMAVEGGQPAGITKARLSSAAFYSNAFNSPGRLYGGRPVTVGSRCQPPTPRQRRLCRPRCLLATTSSSSLAKMHLHPGATTSASDHLPRHLRETKSASRRQRER